MIPGVCKKFDDELRFYPIPDRVKFPLRNFSKCGIVVCIPEVGATLQIYHIDDHVIRPNVTFHAGYRRLDNCNPHVSYAVDYTRDHSMKFIVSTGNQLMFHYRIRRVDFRPYANDPR
jgi:hypothetical protein